MIYSATAKFFTNQDNLARATSAQQLFERSFMQPWCMGAIYAKDEVGATFRVCDHAVHMQHVLLMVIDKPIVFEHVQGKTKSLVRSARKKAVFDAHHEFMKAVEYFASDERLYLDKDCLVSFDKPEDVELYLICLTYVRVKSQNKTLAIAHHYGSDYFAEDCVLDFDDHKQITQTFSLLDFSKIIQALPTMPDISAFLDYHKRYLVQGKPFINELGLLDKFIGDNEVLAPAKAVEEKLVKQKLRQEVGKVFLMTDPAKCNEHFLQILQNARFWHRVIEGFFKQIPQNQLKQKDTLYGNLLDALADESVFSRNNLVRIIAGHMNASAVQRRKGYMVHLRSYTNFARHYVFFFYAQDPTSESCRAKAKAKLHNVAMGVNNMIQDPPLDEILVVGIHDNQGMFATDMYYIKGHKLQNPAINKPLASFDERIYNPTHVVGAANQADANHSASHLQAKSRIRQASKPNAAKKAYDDLASHSKRSSTNTKKRRLQVMQASPNLTLEAGASNRNAPCPCGSGKKFRHCHGAPLDYRA